MNAKEEILLFLEDVVKHALSPRSLYTAITGVPMSYYYSTASHSKGNKPERKVSSLIDSAHVDQLVQQYMDLKNSEWDGTWHVVVFDIPESNRVNRTRFRRSLQSMGFGLYQKSFFVHPRNRFSDAKKMMKEYDLKEGVGFFKIQTTDFPNQESFVEQCWNLASLKMRYNDFLEKIDKRLCNFRALEKKQEPLVMKYIASWLNKVTHQDLYEIMKEDPLLPDSFLPNDWPWKKVITLFQECRKTLKI